MPEPEFLLTKEEAGQATDALPDKATWGDYRNAIAQAQLRKVAAYVRSNSMGAHVRKVTVWGCEEWDALMREAGLEKETPDA